MTLRTKALPRLARTAFLAALMTSVAGAALAAPKHHRAASRADAALAAEVRELRAQLDALKAQVAAQAQAQAQPAAQVEAQQAQLDTLNQQVVDLKSQQDTATADIISLKAPPSGATVTPTLPNGLTKSKIRFGSIAVTRFSTVRRPARRT